LFFLPVGVDYRFRRSSHFCLRRPALRDKADIPATSHYDGYAHVGFFKWR